MPRKGLDEPGNFNRTCGFMGLCRQRHKPGHPAGEIEGSWAIDKESGEKTAAPSTNGGTTAHELIVEIGSEMGAYNAAESGEDIRQCTALEINRVRQRLAVQIWRDYQEHINARIRYADPDADARTRLAEEMEQEEEEAEQALVRLYNEAYLQRMGRPQEFGV